MWLDGGYDFIVDVDGAEWSTTRWCLDASMSKYPRGGTLDLKSVTLIGAHLLLPSSGAVINTAQLDPVELGRPSANGRYVCSAQSVLETYSPR